MQDVLVTSWIATVFENNIRDMPSSLLSSLEPSCKLPAEEAGQGPALVTGTLDVNQGGRCARCWLSPHLLQWVVGWCCKADPCPCRHQDPCRGALWEAARPQGIP